MIEIKNLTKTYGKQVVFDDNNFKFPDTGLVCILGPSGCGKTTLLNILAGFDSKYSGNISVLGTSINEMNDRELCNYRKNNIGFIFQNYNLLSGYTVNENILLACELNNNSMPENKINTFELLKRLNMSNKENEKVENLSGGQKQRVAIARALVNNPSLILADEPTGALDRNNSTEIMELLKEISKERLVLVITHDKKICEFADEIVSIKDGKIVGEEIQTTSHNDVKLKNNSMPKISTIRHSIKNFKVHLIRYICISIAIAIGILAFTLSLSSSNVIKQSIDDFKNKNTAFNSGYIKIDKDNNKDIYSILNEDSRIENVYNQYVIENVSLDIDGKIETMKEKYPMSKATENMSYGVMPRKDMNEIALSPSLAKKFSNSIDKLIGKDLLLSYNGKQYNLKISGIFNAAYDDFFVSLDIENKFYENISKKEQYSISYEVKTFEDIVPVSTMLEEKGIKSENVSEEVNALQNTFDNLQKLFLIVSILILVIGLFISVILLIKLQNSRYKEIGLLAALGFPKNVIRSIIVNENIILSIIASLINTIFIVLTYVISIIFNLSLIITIPQIILSIFGTGIAVILISLIITRKLINTEPAIALKM